jgi:serine/threonine protein kinase
MLTGIRPFRSYSIENVLSRILFWEAINMRMLVPTIPKEISEIAHKMMEKGPKDRYQSAEELKKIVCEQIEVI